MDRQKRVKQIADALMADPRYAPQESDRKRKDPPKPKLKISPKGTNPFKGKVGVLAEYIF